MPLLLKDTINDFVFLKLYSQGLKGEERNSHGRPKTYSYCQYLPDKVVKQVKIVVEQIILYSFPPKC